MPLKWGFHIYRPFLLIVKTSLPIVEISSNVETLRSVLCMGESRGSYQLQLMNLEETSGRLLDSVLPFYFCGEPHVGKKKR